MIIVSGASRGIGLAVANRLTALGHEVMGFARTPGSYDFRLLPIDVTSVSDIQQTADALRQDKVRVTALVNAAGIASMNLALMTPPAVARRVIEVNLLGTMFMCQAFAPLLIRSGGGSIINFSTIAVALALDGESSYVASKAGVESFSRTIARELAPHNIRVNCISPGPIPTDLLRGVSREQTDRIVSRQIFKRQFSTDDVADVVELLLDSRSNSLSGQIFHIGGV